MTRAARRLIPRLEALEAAALAFCRLLERWARGDADAVDGRARARRRSRRRRRRSRRRSRSSSSRWRATSLELEPERAEGGTWFGEPGAAELVDWAPVLARAGVAVDPNRVTAAYLELAVLVRALEGLSAAVAFQASPDRGSLWAGLFDLRENLLRPGAERHPRLAA